MYLDLKAYFKGRQISENVRLPHDITCYRENYKKKLGAIIFIDQSKAFNGVSHEWVQMILAFKVRVW